jgi:hypothetical protein
MANSDPDGARAQQRASDHHRVWRAIEELEQRLRFADSGMSGRTTYDSFGRSSDHARGPFGFDSFSSRARRVQRAMQDAEGQA